MDLESRPMNTQVLSQLVGKRIESIIIAEDNPSPPQDQIILVFDDRTHFEFHGDQIDWSSQVHEGGSEAAMKRIRHPGHIFWETQGGGDAERDA